MNPIVSLVCVSVPKLKEFPNMTAEELIAYCARVSNPANQANMDTGAKLIRYLIKNKHWSPLETVSMTVEINTTRDIARQILRHRSFSFQEFCLSGDTDIYFAYPKKLRDGYYGPTRKIKLADLYDKWANGSQPIPHSHNPSHSIRFDMKDRIRKMQIKCYDEESGKLIAAHIKEVFHTGRKPIYRITLSDGKQIKTTKEHKFLTQTGFDSLENIVGLEMQGDRALMTKPSQIAVNGIPAYQDPKWLAEKKAESLFFGGGLKFLVQKYNINYNTLRKWLKIHNLQYTKKELSIITDGPWNKGVFGYTTKEKSEEVRRKHQQSARKGAQCNLWRGGNSRKRKGLDSVNALSFRRAKNQTCERCGVYGGRTDIHHIIPVSENPDLENVVENWELLCRQCHVDHHRSQNYSGWQAMAATSVVVTPYTVKWRSIDKIEYLGVEETYDIEIDHSSHNYIANGIVTHNSQRYADPTKDLKFITKDARLQDTKNRQNSIITKDKKLKEEWEARQQGVILRAQTTYEWAIKNGIAKEQARAVLPEGNTMSRLYMAGNIRSWVHYCDLRRKNGTQLEHQEIAEACWQIVKQEFPSIVEAIESE